MIPSDRHPLTADERARVVAYVDDFVALAASRRAPGVFDAAALSVGHRVYGLDGLDWTEVAPVIHDRLRFPAPDDHPRDYEAIWWCVRDHPAPLRHSEVAQTQVWLAELAEWDGQADADFPDVDPDEFPDDSPRAADADLPGRLRRMIESLRRGGGLAEARPVPRPPKPAPAPPATVTEPTDPTPLATRVSEADGGMSDVTTADVPPAVAGGIAALAARLDADADDIVTRFEARAPDLFDADRATPGGRVAMCPAASAPAPAPAAGRPPDGPLWFFGDLHGDLLSFEAGLAHVRRESLGPGFSILLLGDLIDDGAHSWHLVLRIMDLAARMPGAIGLIAGNHDDALVYDEARDRFASSVDPSDFAAGLNARMDAGGPGAATARRVGRAAVAWFAGALRAALLPDGLLCAHGGVPLSDLWDSIRTPEDLDRPDCLQDFAWTRAHPRAKRKIPNRTTRGCEFGREDLEGFAAVMERVTGRAVTGFVRGHDHVDERFDPMPLFRAVPTLTLNTLGHRLPREMFGAYPRMPAIARWMPGGRPAVTRLRVDEAALRTVYPEPRADDATHPTDAADAADASGTAARG